MSQTLARFAKCGGDLHKYSRRFHSLTIEQRRVAVELIEQGIEADKAIKTARRAK